MNLEMMIGRKQYKVSVNRKYVCVCVCVCVCVRERERERVRERKRDNWFVFNLKWHMAFSMPGKRRQIVREKEKERERSVCLYVCVCVCVCVREKKRKRCSNRELMVLFFM